MERVAQQNPDLDEQVAGWRAANPDGTLEQAVRDLGLWPRNPRDADAQRIIWLALRRLSDSAAIRLGFHAMRNAHVLMSRDTAPRRSSPGEGVATDCAAATSAGGTG
ncbi:MAG TPA: hypothetical protein VN969_33120 [Streptosporangiaceae bacterium]|nr:hypothetical protein [Streptosporangiaceae bacterium]